MSIQDKVKPQVTISNDNMEAYIFLPLPNDDEYTVDDIKIALAEKGVIFGIDDAMLHKIAEEKIYTRNIRIAQGELPVDGVDGFYEYNFKSTFNKHPKIRPDGSVDYWSMNLIETVMQGQVIAIYNPAIQGKPGTTVKGTPIHEKRGKELPPLKGKGFERENDNLTYVSSMDGKIELQNDRILILPIYEIYGNVDLSIGNIDFLGDVVIHGNVGSGVTIKTSGSITVDGVVEMAKLYAGKDIILRSGMLGGKKGTVYAKKNIYAKFFEYTEIEAVGFIEADVFFDCEVYSQENIYLSGKHGSIVGGHVYAANGVEAGEIGNEIGINTYVSVGVGIEEFQKLHELKNKVKETEVRLDKLEKVLTAFEKLEVDKGVSYKNDPRRMQVLRERIKDSATINADRAEIEKLEELIEKAKHASIRVVKNVYPGVMVKIGNIRHTVTEAQCNLEFVNQLDHIHMIRLDEKVVS